MPTSPRPIIRLLALVLISLLAACNTVRQLAENAPVQRLVPQVISARPHDITAWTQGLLVHDGYLYESTGQTGFSTLRQVDLLTGEVLRSVPIAFPNYYGEGLALVDDRLIQLTWTEQIAIVYDLETFTPLGTFTYDGEGWGLCYDGEFLYMSNGSSTLTRRDPATFAALEQIPVLLDDQPVTRLNELECVGPWIYANVWQTDQIMCIDKATGRVSATIDAFGLADPQTGTVLSGTGGGLNGIALDPETSNFLITGKLWPWLFEVQFVPAPG
jgi:glutaminyl-peptide cyclotransferase